MARLIIIAVAAALAVSGCGRKQSFQPVASRVTGEGAPLDQIPLGNPPGRPATIASEIKNPFEGDAGAVQQGQALFGEMNCAYCHGFGAPGLMGPSLNDRAWRYGGTPAEIFRSIHDGRPKGMPAFGDRLPDQEIWKLVAFIESLGGASPPATPEMTKLAPPMASATGEQPAEQDKADSANQSHERSNAGGRTSS